MTQTLTATLTTTTTTTQTDTSYRISSSCLLTFWRVRRPAVCVPGCVAGGQLCAVLARCVYVCVSYGTAPHRTRELMGKRFEHFDVYAIKRVKRKMCISFCSAICIMSCAPHALPPDKCSNGQQVVGKRVRACLPARLFACVCITLIEMCLIINYR